MTRATLTIHTGDAIPTTVDFNVTTDSEIAVITISPFDVRIKTPNEPKLINLKDDARFDDLFTHGDGATAHVGPFGRPGGSNSETSIRTYNLAKREGVETVGDLLNLTDDDVRIWRNHNPETLDQIGAMQARVRELRGD